MSQPLSIILWAIKGNTLLTDIKYGNILIITEIKSKLRVNKTMINL